MGKAAAIRKAQLDQEVILPARDFDKSRMALGETKSKASGLSRSAEPSGLTCLAAALPGSVRGAYRTRRHPGDPA